MFDVLSSEFSSCLILSKIRPLSFFSSLLLLVIFKIAGSLRTFFFFFFFHGSCINVLATELLSIPLQCLWRSQALAVLDRNDEIHLTQL